MKYYFSLTIIFAVSQLLFSQYTTVPDPVFENYLENNGMGDGVLNNQQVLTSNINTVTLLALNNLNITNLTGIEDFIVLETFGITGANLSSLDLSNNNELTFLLCYENDIEELLLNSDKLEYIECQYNNLTSLDLSNVPNLELLWCFFNSLTSLDISVNTKLIQINFSNNFLQSLDFSNNIDLLLIGGGNLNSLNYLDIRNGNNENIANFNIFNTNSLDCIYVDDASAGYLDNWFKDANTTFVNNEEECNAIVGTEDYINNNLNIYPNPTKNIFNINIDQVSSYKLINHSGRIIKKGDLLIGNNQINISDISIGIYYLQIQNNITTNHIKIFKN